MINAYIQNKEGQSRSRMNLKISGNINASILNFFYF
jgi:hypothetical protein